MTTLATLLVATNLSDLSRHAAQRAALLTTASGSRAELVHVLALSRSDVLVTPR